MSFTPEPGTPLAEYYAQTQPRIGAVLSRRSLGTLDAVTIGRYAMTIGAADPSHYDPAAARSAGYADVVAPPNMLAAIVQWGVGTPEAQLQPDGTPHDGDMPLGDGDLGLRVMGAGEEMELVNPVCGYGAGGRNDTRGGHSQTDPVRPVRVRHHHQHLLLRGGCRSQPQPAHRRAAQPIAGVVMSKMFRVGDELPPLKHTATPFQLFRYSAVTWNPHRIHFDEPYAREEGHDGVALHSHLRAALALRCVAEGLGPGWHVTKVAYRLRKPVYAPAELAYTARVTATEGDTMTLELIEQQPSGEVGFEGTVSVGKTPGATP